MSLQPRLVLLAAFIFTLNVFAFSERKFTAAPKHAGLRRRDTSFDPSYDDLTLVFAEGTSDKDAAASVYLKPKQPTLILEDVDDHIESITCFENQIILSFYGNRAFQSAREVWQTHHQFTLITNHAECHNADEHAAWSVTFDTATSDTNSISLWAEPSTLRSSMSRMKVEIGSHVTDHVDLKKLARRQTPTPSPTSSNVASGSPATTFTYSSPTATATGASVSADVSFSRIGTVLVPPDLSIIDHIPGMAFLQNVRLSCVNCTMTGNIALTAGGFEVDTDDMEIDEAEQFLQQGFLEFDATNISAHMEFELAFLPGFTIQGYTARLPSIPLGAITIVGIINFGPTLDLTFPIAMTLESPVTFRAGFKLSAPPSLKIHLDVAAPTNSSTTGFGDIDLDVLPFSADAKNLTLGFTAGFRPELVVGAGLGSSIPGYSVGGGVGVFLDLPLLSATLEQLENVNEKCEPDSSGKNKSAVCLRPSLTYGGGSQWGLEAVIAGFNYSHEDEPVTLASTATMLPTQCLSWDAKHGSLVDAQTTASQTASGGNSGSTGTAESIGEKHSLDGKFAVTMWLFSLAVILS